MAIDKICLFTIVASFVVFGCIQAGAAYRFFTLQKYEGVWYDIGRTPPAENGHLYSCSRSEIKARDYLNQTFTQTRYSLLNGDKLIKNIGHGTVIGDKVHVEFPDVSSTEFVFAVIDEYDQDENIIVREMNHGFYAILSRNNHILTEAKRYFDRLAVGAGVQYFDQDNCQNMPI